MPATFRVGTFNFENLFSRARVLNLQDHTRTAAVLAQVGQLEQLLGKAAYSATDKTQIKKLATDLSAYIEIREDRGKLFTGRGNARRVTASGAGAWDGGVDFKRADLSDMARESTVTVVKELNADILCCVEIEDRQMLQAFNSQTLDSRKFKYSMLIDGNDPRGIDVGLLSKFEIVNIRTHIFDRDSTGVVFSRDCLEVELRLPDGRSVHILCNHLKSQGYGTQAGNDAKRRRQSVRLAQILSRYNLATDLVIVAGDLNAAPASASLKPLLNVVNLFDVLALQFPSAPEQRWTYKYKNDLNQIDYLLVSRPLKLGFQRASIERRGVFGIQNIIGQAPFSSVTSATTAASDHCGVVAEFQV
jgi:endonuclease/exonuclease/phosphatase family metal-dependent hydrolase